MQSQSTTVRPTIDLSATLSTIVGKLHSKAPHLEFLYLNIDTLIWVNDSTARRKKYYNREYMICSDNETLLNAFMDSIGYTYWV